MHAKPERERCLAIARELLEHPTAAVKEDLPQRYIHSFARSRPSLKLSQDKAGNLLLRYPGAGALAKKPPLILVAHLDHPSFWIKSVNDGRVELIFKGGVGIDHARPGTRLRYFTTASAAPTGAGEIIDATGKDGRLESANATLSQGKAIADGFAMWDFPGFSLVEDKIVTRCCDDLLGAAAALCTLDIVARAKLKTAPLWGLFTRAEEIGFMGALEAVRLKVIPKKACVLSLECSKAFPHTPQGGGVIVRVGDKTSIFDPQLTNALCKAGEMVKKSDPEFKFQRRLMDGGTCEASVFCAHGFRSSGLALPLGNYHNQAFSMKGKPEIGPENVHAGDFLAEVQLLTELAQHPEWLAESRKLPEWVAKRAAEARKALQ
jgi:endoglucanase